MSDTDPSEPAEDWATLERQNLNSALYVDTSDTGVLLCRACRVSHRCRLGIASEALAADETVLSDLACPVDHEGGPDVAHGGWTASVLDEMSGHALLLRDEFAVTGTLTVTFVKPVPISRRLIGRVWIAEREGRRVHVSAELRLRDTNDLLATSAAVMIRRPGDHFDRHQSWLSTR